MAKARRRLGERELRAARTDYLGNLLVRTKAVFKRDVLRCLRRRGYELQERHMPVFRCLDLDGSTISEIAARAGLSKQTTGPVVRELEGMSLVAVGRDPRDGRARHVRFTAAGERALRAVLDAIQAVTDDYRKVVGRQRLDDAMATLKTLLEAAESDD